MNEFTIQDYSTISTICNKMEQEYNLCDLPSAFYYLSMDMLFDLQDDEIDDCITDTNYLKLMHRSSGKDGGIDAVYIDETNSTINLLNYKYAMSYAKAKNNFPSKEISDISDFFSNLMVMNRQALTDLNETLRLKLEEIWELIDKRNMKFVVHFCSNYSCGLEANQKERILQTLSRFSNVEFKEHTGVDFSKGLSKSRRNELNAKIKAIDENYFIKNDGDYKALIVNIDARDLIRAVSNKNEDRENPNFIYEEDIPFIIDEDAFDANVRIYLKQRTNVNKNIKATVLSPSKKYFFYYNNGITITCKKVTCPKNQRSPIIELEDLQIVNGSQTIHALYDVIKEKVNALNGVDILVRIYEIKEDFDLSTNIAEYTNSQNKVESRDIRSIDSKQILLERELEVHGYYYERKKHQYQNKPRDKRLDSEKTGQILLSYNNQSPGDSKNNKKCIFSSRYDEVFNDKINANEVLAINELYKQIEYSRKIWKQDYDSKDEKDNKEIFRLYSSYYILALCNLLLKKNGENLTQIHQDDKYKDRFCQIIKDSTKMVEKEYRDFIKDMEEKKEIVRDYSRPFKYNTLYDQIIKNNSLIEIKAELKQLYE